MKELKKELADFIIEIDWEGVEGRSYSGRAMYGKRCPAIVTGNFSDLIEVIFEAVDWLKDDYEEGDIRALLSNVKQDSLGYDTVYYWPSITITE